MPASGFHSRPRWARRASSGPASRSSSKATRVTITPRIRGKNPETADSVVDRRANIRIDTTLVLIPVAVTDPMGRFVTGLDKENFKLFEDKVEQEILQFSSEDAPLSVGIVFDTSGSMGSKLAKSRKAVTQFHEDRQSGGRVFLIQFNDRPEMVVPFTPDTEEIQNRLTFTQAKGRTALLDGVYMAMNQMKKARNPRKAILIISDGGDNSSRYTESEVKNAVREADVQIYAIGIFEPMASRGRTPEEMSRTGAAGRGHGADRRAAFRGRQSGGTAGRGGQDRNRAAQSVRARVHSEERWLATENTAACR